MKYQIQKGDTLYDIAKAFYGHGWLWRLLAIRNQLKDANKIQVGQVIHIPFLYW